MNEGLAIIDLDKTLIYGDSIVALSKVFMEYELIESNFWVKSSTLDFDSYYHSITKKKQLSDIFYALPDKKQSEIIKELLKSSDVKGIKSVINRIDSETRNNFVRIVSTASLDFVALSILEQLNFNYDFLHCSSFRNYQTEKVCSTLNNSGGSKLSLIKNYLKASSKPEEIVTFSDHFSDLPILLIANRGFVVKNRDTFDDWSEHFNFNTLSY